jgi:hypothetical protein
MIEIPAIEGVSYPATTVEIAAECGDSEVSLPDGTERVGDVYERVSVTTCADAEEARDVFTMAVGESAIGRKGYSDREPPVPGADREPLSL